MKESYFKVGPGMVSKLSHNTWNGNYRVKNESTISNANLKRLNTYLTEGNDPELSPYVDKEFRDNILSCKPVEFFKENNRVYTKFYVRFEESVNNDTDSILSYIKEYIEGQCSDGWGEGFEQRPFYTNRTENGYVDYSYSPWTNKDDFKVEEM